jgi:DNA-binding NarL/FixJ family response regulator
MANTRRRRFVAPLRVLLLEDSDADAELIVESLTRAHIRAQTERVSTRAAFIESLSRMHPDVVLCDHGIASFGGPAALELMRELSPITPMIMVSGSLDEVTAVACLRAGAESIVLKSNLGRLPEAIADAISVRKRLRALSPRQLQVLQLVAQGDTTREIARKLHVGVKTAETHRAEVMRRLGKHDVVSLVRFALRTGIITSES